MIANLKVGDWFKKWDGVVCKLTLLNDCRAKIHLEDGREYSLSPGTEVLEILPRRRDPKQRVDARPEEGKMSKAEQIKKLREQSVAAKEKEASLKRIKEVMAENEKKAAEKEAKAKNGKKTPEPKLARPGSAAEILVGAGGKIVKTKKPIPVKVSPEKPESKKAATEKPKAKGNGSGKRVIAVFGTYPVTGVLRWMGVRGFSFNDAVNALKSTKLTPMPTDLCVLTYLYRGKKGVGEPAKMTGDQQKKLMAFKGKS